MEEEQMVEQTKRFAVLEMVLRHLPVGADMEYATKQASILYEYLYNNKLTTKNK